MVEGGQEWRDQAYVRGGAPKSPVEAVLGLSALAIVPVALVASQYLVAIFSSLFAAGFLTVAALSLAGLLQVVTLRRMGRRALGRLRAAAPAAGLIGLCGLLLVVAAQMAEPFEDGYGHWLVAANLDSTGHLHDPLFGMEDTWLPGYHVLAAAVLLRFRLWQLGALKVLGAMLGPGPVTRRHSVPPHVPQRRV